MGRTMQLRLVAVLVLVAAASALPMAREAVKATDAVSLGEGAAANPTPSPVTLPALEKEIQDRKSQVETLDNLVKSTDENLLNKVNAREAATKEVVASVTSEASARQEKDAEFTGDIKTLNGEVSKLSDKLDTDNGAVVAAVGKTDKAVADGTSNREADTKSTNAAITAAASAVDTKVAAAKTELQAENTKLTNSVTAAQSALEGKVTANTNALNTESEARKAADDKEKATIAGLQAQLSTVVTALQDVQQGKNIDISAIQGAMEKAKADSAQKPEAPAKEAAAKESQ